MVLVEEDEVKVRDPYWQVGGRAWPGRERRVLTAARSPFRAQRAWRPGSPPPKCPQVESDLYGELKRDLGEKNFKLFAETVNLKEWKRKGPYVPPEADMGSKRNAQAFPPLLTRWSLRQTKEVCVDMRAARGVGRGWAGHAHETSAASRRLARACAVRCVDILRGLLCSARFTGTSWHLAERPRAADCAGPCLGPASRLRCRAVLRSPRLTSL